jgi:hypothetical protein
MGQAAVGLKTLVSGMAYTIQVRSAVSGAAGAGRQTLSDFPWAGVPTCNWDVHCNTIRIYGLFLQLHRWMVQSCEWDRYSHFSHLAALLHIGVLGQMFLDLFFTSATIRVVSL